MLLIHANLTSCGSDHKTVSDCTELFVSRVGNKGEVLSSLLLLNGSASETEAFMAEKAMRELFLKPNHFPLQRNQSTLLDPLTV